MIICSYFFQLAASIVHIIVLASYKFTTLGKCQNLGLLRQFCLLYNRQQNMTLGRHVGGKLFNTFKLF